MKRGVKVLCAVAVLLLVAAGPSWATCIGLSLPVFQGGASGVAARPDSQVTGMVGGVAGFWWIDGQGNPTIGTGNDSGGLGNAAPVADALWFVRNNGVAGDLAGMRWDWANAGSDGCPNGAPTTLGALAAYLIDSAGNYALMAVNGTTTPVPSYDYDTLTQSNVMMKPSSLMPRMTVDLASLTDTTAMVDVDSAASSVNCYDDGSGLCARSSLVRVKATGLRMDSPGGPPVEATLACPAAGCNDIVLMRGHDYCWDQGADLLGAGGNFCSGFPTLACTPGDPTACFGGAAGVCIFIGTPFPPEIEAGCVRLEASDISDQALNARSEKAKGNVIFRWDASTFNVSHFNVVGTSRGDRVLNESPIFAKSNDGVQQSYEVAIPNGQIRFDRSFKIQTVLNDGTVRETPVE